MAWSRYQQFLALTMVVTGSINTLSTKWADNIEAAGADGSVRKFQHPFFQASCMFLGELLCLLTFKVLLRVSSRRTDDTADTTSTEHSLTRGNRHFQPLVLFVPAMCDMCSTSLMYIGLNLTYASSFQMFRGSVLVFVGLLSVAFLGRELTRRHWAGIATLIAGLAVVGTADFLAEQRHAPSAAAGVGAGAKHQNDVITGDLLIVIAQVITAVQMVVEERYVAGWDIPALQAVGWEGLFGFITLAGLQVPFYYVHTVAPFTNQPSGRLEDAVDAVVQIGNSPTLAVAILGTILSIAFFNYAGISVTKEMSAITRMVLDSVRTVVIWLFSMALMGQQFHWLQLVGFVLLSIGMCIYYGVTCRVLLLYGRQVYFSCRGGGVAAADDDATRSIIEHEAANQPSSDAVTYP